MRRTPDLCAHAGLHGYVNGKAALSGGPRGQPMTAPASFFDDCIPLSARDLVESRFRGAGKARSMDMDISDAADLAIVNYQRDAQTGTPSLAEIEGLRDQARKAGASDVAERLDKVIAEHAARYR